MRFWDAIWWAWKSVSEARARAVLCIVGVMIGAVLITAMANLGDTYYATIKGIFIRGTNPTAIIVFPTSRPFTDADIARLAGVKGVKAIAPIITVSCKLVGTGGVKYVQILGISEKAFKEVYPGVKAAEGTLVIAPGTVVAGWDVAHQGLIPFLTPGTYAILQCSKSSNLRVMVSGVLGKVGFMFGTNLDNSVVTSPETLRLLGIRGYGMVILIAKSLNDVDHVAKKVESLFPRGKASVFVIKYVLESVKKALNMLTLFLVAIAGVSTLVAGIGITATMIMAVHQRAREVGVLKTFGFTKSDIVKLFILEAFITGVVGGLAGVGLGNVVGYLLAIQLIGSQMRTVNYVVSPSGQLIALTYSVIVALVAGAYPAWRASRLRPVEILRYE